tara:strand:- start:513 stop:1187 length:675 start_codon:yes stop_codon:yes gene_type:complete
MQDLSTLTDAHRNQLESELPFIWLYELQTPDDPPQRYRVTNFTQRVYFGEDSSGNRLRYDPIPVVHGAVEENTEGALPSISITLGNVGSIMASTFDGADGFVGMPFRISLVSSLELDNPAAAIINDGSVVSCSISSEVITLSVSAFELYQQEAPAFLFSRRRCRFAYGTGSCGFDLAAAGIPTALLACNGTIEACTERGDDEVSRSRPRLHPLRFGGFPGIPRQ